MRDGSLGTRDARSVPDADANLRTVWGEFVREWIEELRRMLDDAYAGRPPGRY